MRTMSGSRRPARRIVTAVVATASLALGVAPAAAGASAPADVAQAPLVAAPLAAAAPADDVTTEVINAINEERAKKKTWVGADEVNTPLKPLTVLPCTTQQAVERAQVGKWDPSQQGSPDMDLVRAACNLHNQSVGNMGPAGASGRAIVDGWMKDTTSRSRLLGAFTHVGVACRDVGEAKGGWSCEAIFSNPAQVGGLGPDRPVGQLPVMVFGDSYTAGNGVGDGVKGWRVGLPGGDPKTDSLQSPRNQSKVMAEILAGRAGRPYCARPDQVSSNCVTVNDYSHSGSVTMAPGDPGGALVPPDATPQLLLPDETPREMRLRLLAADSDTARSDLHKTKTLKQQIDQAEKDYKVLSAGKGGEDAMYPQGVFVVGIGGNDIAFSTIAQYALIPQTAWSAVSARTAIKNAEGLLDPAVDRTRGQITRLIENASPNSVVLVQGYPYLANSNGSPPIRECLMDGEHVHLVNCTPVVGKGTWTTYQPGSDLRAFQEQAERRFQTMVDDLGPLAETYGVEVRFVPYAEPTDGQAPYLPNITIAITRWDEFGSKFVPTFANPSRGITTAFEVGDEHEWCSGVDAGNDALGKHFCSKMQWIHPGARLRAQEGELLDRSLTTSPVSTQRAVILGTDDPGADADAYAPKLTTPTGALSAGRVGEAYGTVFHSEGSSARYSVQGGSLPDGLYLYASGALSGTPSRAGDYTFTIRATSRIGSTDRWDEADYTIHVDERAPDAPATIEAPTPESPAPTPTVGQDYSYAIEATGNPSPTFVVSEGELPPGMHLHPDAGLIGGTPALPGDYSFTVTAYNTVAGQLQMVTAPFVLSVVLPEPEPVPSVIVSGAAPAGKVGEAYAFMVEAEGFPAPVFAVTEGDLPPGLGLDAVTGAVTGTPTAVGEYVFTVTASNVISSDSVELTIEVSEPDPVAPVIVSGAAPAGTIEVVYTFTVEATGYPLPTFAVTEGDLPPGLELDPVTGTITGVPTVVGEYTVTVTASNVVDGETQSDSVELVIEVSEPDPGPVVPVITLGAVPVGTVGAPYGFTVEAIGNPAPTFAVSEGTLPPGLTLDPATGTIAGTPALPGQYTVTVTASNTVEGEARSDSVQFTLYVELPEAAPVITSGAAPAGTVDVAYSFTVEATGNPAPRFEVTDGALPPGLVLDAVTGSITGTPSVVGEFTVTVTASNTVAGETQTDSAELTIVVYQAGQEVPPVITVGLVPAGTVGASYAFTVQATGSPAPTFAVTSGSLPDGLVLDPVTGSITGTPSVVGEFEVTVTASNTVDGQARSDSVELTFVVGEAGAEEVPPVITVGAVPAGTVGASYAFTVQATGSPAPTFAVTSGSLPDGLVLDAVTGSITGTPSVVGEFEVTVTASNTVDGQARSDSVELTFVVGEAGADAPPVIMVGPVPDGTVGAAYAFAVQATGSPVPTFAVTDGALPPGLVLDPVSGTIAGTPALPGQYTVTVTASNTVDGQTRSDSAQITIHVGLGSPPDIPSDSPPVITVGTVPPGTVGTAYAFTVQATGSPAPTFAVTSGSLPAGLVLDPVTGTITGVPSVAGEFTVTITASNTVAGQARTDSAELTVVVYQAGADVPPVITVGTVPAGTVGAAYAFAVQATGNPAPRFAVTAGALPPGLSLDPVAGTITGTPSVAGEFEVTITASNTVAGQTRSDSARFTIRVDRAGDPVDTPSTTPSGTPGTTPGGPGRLPLTGAGSAGAIGLFAALALLLGAGAVVVRRRTSS
ncbi:MAG: putative Ig domain-containing protein [Micrococcales bacterium]|nr:putative Ig domain-containing protein [Micrococcales bacterium]